MKKELTLILGLLCILFSNYAIAYGCSTRVCGKSYYSQRSSASGCAKEDTCQCVDPACQEGNSCMSVSKCCRAFGNIGG